MKLNEFTAVEAAAQISAGRITSEQLIRACLDRIAERESDVRAWAFISPDQAIAEARARDRGPRRGLLNGLADCGEDVIDMADMPTEHGTPIYKGNQRGATRWRIGRAPSKAPSSSARRSRPSLRTCIPPARAIRRNLGHTPGGSSSGPAAAVADCMAPLGFGTQTGGSLIRPASYCGIVAYKPTLDFISTAGVKALSANLDTVGVYGRTVPDAALIGGALIGFDALDFGAKAGCGPAHWRDRMLQRVARRAAYGKLRSKESAASSSAPAPRSSK